MSSTTIKQSRALSRAIAEVRSQGFEVRWASRHADKRHQGIHLLNPGERELMDALETAERDGFNTIWLHTERTWHERPSKGSKAHRRKALQGWIDKFNTNSGGAYSLDKLVHKQGELGVLFDRLTDAQLGQILALIVASYTTGCFETRCHIEALKRQLAEEARS